MKFLLIPTAGPTQAIDVAENDLLSECYKRIRCDCIETVTIKIQGRSFIMIVDESGKLNGQNYNSRATLLYAPGLEYIAGNAIIGKIADTANGLDIVGLDNDEIYFFERLFGYITE